MVRTGAVAYELCRPLDLYALWYARAIAWRTAPVLLRAVPMFVFAMVVAAAARLPELAARTAAERRSRSAMWFAASPVRPGARLRDLDADQHHADVDDHRRRHRRCWSRRASTMFGRAGRSRCRCSPTGRSRCSTALPFAGLLDLPLRVYTGDIAPASAALGARAPARRGRSRSSRSGAGCSSRGLRRLVVQGG